MKEIKMRVNYKQDSSCSNCGITYKNTKEMHDIMLFGEVHQICYDCLETLFQKILKSQVNYQSKLKTKEDLERIKRSQVIKERNQK